MDLKQLEVICTNWGIADFEIFASATMMKPFNPESGRVHVGDITQKDIAKFQMKAKDRILHLLHDTSLIPRELIFVGRNLNLVRANNKEMGSIVNRVHILASFAARGVNIGEQRITTWRTSFQDMAFQSRLFSISLLYYLAQIYQNISAFVFGRKVDDIEEQVEAKFGLKLSTD